MSRPFYASDILDTFKSDAGDIELVATIDAQHDPASGKLHAELDAFLRHVRMTGPDAISRPGWLPKPQEASEGVDPSEATDLARDLFHRWTAKVRGASADRRG